MCKSRDTGNKRVLDCETNEMARDSVSYILGISRDDLVLYLRGFTFKDTDGVDVLFNSVLKEFNTSWGFSHTAWFHLTRCFPGNKFENGLLPLSVMKDEIWNFLFSVCKCSIDKTDWDKFRKDVENNTNGYFHDIYRIRTSRDTQDGPDGILIGDVNFNRAVSQAHFLDQGPEFVMLICEAFRTKYGHDLKNDYISATKPCIVKFITKDHDIDYILRALNYLYELEQAEPNFGIAHSTCYIGKGTPIPAGNIEKVIFVET